MVQDNLSFDPRRDKQAVEQFGFVNLSEALKTGIIPDTVEAGENAYNGIDNPESILGRPRDVFDSIHMQNAINSYQPEKVEND